MHWEVDGRLFCAGTSHILSQKKFHRSTWDDKLLGWAVEKVPAPERLRPLRMHDGGVGSQCSCVSVHPLKCSHQVLFYIYFHISLSLIVINSHNVDNWKEKWHYKGWFGGIWHVDNQQTNNKQIVTWQVGQGRGSWKASFRPPPSDEAGSDGEPSETHISWSCIVNR